MCTLKITKSNGNKHLDFTFLHSANLLQVSAFAEQAGNEQKKTLMQFTQISPWGTECDAENSESGEQMEGIQHIS